MLRQALAAFLAAVRLDDVSCLHGSRPRAAVLGVAVVLSVVAACSTGETDRGGAPAGDGPATTAAADPTSRAEEHGRLRVAADAAGIRVGAAAKPGLLEGPSPYADTLAAHFSSLTPENHLKWPLVHPEPGVWQWEEADALVDFAEDHGMEIRGHTLIWAQDEGNGIPPWVEAIDDPDELRETVTDHISTVVGRYRGRIERWDVVNEPLQTLGAGPDPTHFQQVLGEEHIDLAFRAAAEADPDAELWLNEHSAESIPEKGDALVALVERLLERDVPLDGVGIQGHQFSGRPPESGRLARASDGAARAGRRRGDHRAGRPALGDPRRGGPGRRLRAADSRVPGGRLLRDHRVGVDDGHTWLDDFIGRDDTDPLLFDESYEPKPTYDAVARALEGP
ncbi:MAG: endo-1,4-beta-xylanase [Acidimicrobiia bacterium]|nr:endo-1,4-beta-xylanase [Acidimicrobiia bacterium]